MIMQKEEVFIHAKNWWINHSLESIVDNNRIGIFQYDSIHAWYIGWSVDNLKEIILETRYKSGISTTKYSSNEIKCYETKRGNKYRIHFVLLSASEEDVFCQLIQDLVITSEQYEEENLALAMVLERYLKWKEMFKHSSCSREKYQGLFGELIVLKWLIENNKDRISEIINGWMGPEYDKQDFILADEWFEVKTILYNKSSVTITSLAQLDRRDIPGKLCVVKVCTSETKQEGYCSVYDLYQRIKDILVQNPVDKLNFETKIENFGQLMILMDQFLWFKTEMLSVYVVDDSFPVLPVFTDLPTAITSVIYTLSIPGLESWKIQEVRIND